MENRSTRNDSNNIDKKDIIQYLNKILDYAEDIYKFKCGIESEKSDFVLTFEEFINQYYYNEEKNNNKIESELSDLVKVQLMKQIYPGNDNIKSDYYLELNDGEALFIEKNREYKTIKISKETYQKGEIIELDKNKKIVLIILIKTKDEKNNISLYCLDVINQNKNIISEYHYTFPPIKDYSCCILEQIEKKDIIMLFCCKKEIHFFKLSLNISNYKFDDDNKVEDHIDVEDEPTSICLIKKIKMPDNILENNILYNTGLFLVSIKSNFKFYKYDENGNIIFIFGIGFEKENNDIFKEDINIKNFRQLDDGIITIHLNNKIYNSCLIMKEKKEKEKIDV
jgi:hypothetical protein